MHAVKAAHRRHADASSSYDCSGARRPRLAQLLRQRRRVHHRQPRHRTRQRHVQAAQPRPLVRLAVDDCRRLVRDHVGGEGVRGGAGWDEDVRDRDRGMC
ncbi:hypothetical protein [Streptomyces atratus]|uniref:hypothetical protein n=1 Tax=Streptomyces atratus TaxID=1893 RepID=UPI0021A913EC|nr:hypothetical protein [Streptomyces atratus]MCT2546907.1 hypothetical protein [Streptomyces atratus]